MDDFAAVAGEVVGSEAPRNDEHLPTRSQNMKSKKYYCRANDYYKGAFGELVWAATLEAAKHEFHRIYGAWPTSIQIIKGAW